MVKHIYKLIRKTYVAELNAKDANDLAELWQSLCKELRAKENSVTYVARA